MEEFKISKLEGSEGWTLWKFQVRVVLRAGGLWNIANGTAKKPNTSGRELQEWLSADAKAQRILVISMGEEPMLHIMNCDTAAEMWTFLESVYEQKSETSIHLLQQQFFQYVKSPEDSIAVHISKLQKMAKQLEDLGDKISENMLITKILMTLPGEYNHFFASWEATAREERTLKNLTSRLSMEETRLGIRPSNSEAFLAKGKTQRKLTNTNKKQTNQSSKGKCFKCGEFGHWKRECTMKSEKKFKKNGDAFIGEQIFLESTTLKDEGWYVDSGASDHMCNRREWFTDYKIFKQPRRIRVGNGAIILAYGFGDIYVEAFDGKMWRSKYLSNVLYVPDIKLNLFSTSVCLDKGYVMEAEADYCVFKRDGQTFLKGVRENSKLFKLVLKVAVNSFEQANTAVSEKSLKIWHERMCHQNKLHVKEVLDQKKIKYTGNYTTCEGCLMGKQTRMPFSERKNRADKVGDLVHTDLCDPKCLLVTQDIWFYFAMITRIIGTYFVLKPNLKFLK